jgi:predicted transglutaminase-like protease
LLSNIYPDKEIYFVHTKSHIATGIKIEDKIYILDQHLPVLTIDQWHKREHSDKTTHKMKEGKLQAVKTNSLLSKTKPAKLNNEKLTMEISKLLNISKQHTDNIEAKTLKLPPWKKGAFLYTMNDDIVNYSLAKALEKKISNELIKLDQLTGLELIKERNEDFTFQISFKANK